jgi:hypothetical protein
MRWRFAKLLLVKQEGGFVIICKLVAFFLTSLGRVVVDVLAKDVFAEIVPVRFRVHQVEMPCLVYFIRGSNRLGTCGAEEKKLFVLNNYTFCKGGCPVVFAGQPLREG